MIEVEQKFMLTAQTRSRLASLGGCRVATEHLCDTYYDTSEQEMMGSDHWLRKRGASEQEMMGSDHWLRKRGARWELKCRDLIHSRQEVGGDSVCHSEEGPACKEEVVLQGTVESEGGVLQDTYKTASGVLQDTDHYTEETDESSILAHLEERFRIKSKNAEMKDSAIVAMDTLVECGVLVPIVEVKCVRESYVIRESGEGVRVGCGWEEVRVDLDECVCGESGEVYGVGEVEIMVSSSALVGVAADRCRSLALQLGE